MVHMTYLTLSPSSPHNSIFVKCSFFSGCSRGYRFCYPQLTVCQASNWHQVSTSDTYDKGVMRVVTPAWFKDCCSTPVLINQHEETKSVATIRQLVLMTFLVSDPPGPIDNSNIFILKGNTKVLKPSKFLQDLYQQATIMLKILL